TEIFGEMESSSPAPPAPAPARSPSRELSRPTTVPPRPPPGRPSSQRPIADTPPPLAAARAPSMGGMQDGLAATAGAGYNPGTYPPPLGTPPGPQPAMPGPMSGSQM